MKKLISIFGMIVVLTMLLSAAGPSGRTTWAGGPLPVSKMPKVETPVTVTWLGHAAFKLESEGKTIFIDPFITNNPTCPIEVGDITAADLILVTHDHGDHVGDTIYIANQFDAPVVAMPETLTRLVNEELLDEELAAKRNIGGASEVDGISVIMTEAIHSAVTASPAGYIIKFPGGAIIYHAGDTGIFANMQVYGALYPMHIALLPIGGHYTMDAMEAANSLILLKPAMVIPMHFATWVPPLAPDAGEFVNLAKKIAPEVDVIVLEPNGSYTLQPSTY